MPKPGEPELRPHSRGRRVHLQDLRAGDIVDRWAKRSGGFFLQEDQEVLEVFEDGRATTTGGRMLNRDVGWAEMRLIRRPGQHQEGGANV